MPEPQRRGRPAAIRPCELVRWTGLLRSCSAYGAYLRVERDRVEPVGVIRFLVLNPDFPRAIRFCVARCRESLQEIAGGDDDEYASEAERLLGRLDSELRYIDVGEIFERGLLPFLDGIQTTCLRVGDEIQRSYFLDVRSSLQSHGTESCSFASSTRPSSAYSDPVTETVFEVRMAPPSDEDQTNLGYRLRIVPSAPVTIYRDGFGNRVDLFNILTAYSELIIRATSIVRTHRGPSPESRLAGVEWAPDPDRVPRARNARVSPAQPAGEALCRSSTSSSRGLPRPEGRLIDVIEQLTERCGRAWSTRRR